MSKIMLEKYPREKLVFVFANTGAEHPKTLEFVDRVDNHLNLNLVWVEAVVHSRDRYSTSHRIVNFDSATRDMRLFKDMTYKYGLPGPGWLHCTRELKERPIHSYVAFKKQQICRIKARDMDTIDFIAFLTELEDQPQDPLLLSKSNIGQSFSCLSNTKSRQLLL